MTPSPTLVIQTAFLGDVVLTIPLLQALAEEHGPVDVVTTPGAASLIETHPSVRRVIRWDKNGKEGPGAWGLGKALKAEGYERVYLPHRSVRSALVAKLTGAPERIGFADAPLLARFLYTRTHPRSTDQHESRRLLALLGDTVSAGDWRMVTTAEDDAKATAWLRERGIADGFVALAPGSIWGTKRWPFYPELAALLGRQVVVIGGKEDAALGDAVVAAAPDKAKSAVGQLSLRESAALIRKAALLVTNDSAPLHLATAVGTPILAIFGPTVPAFGYGPIRPGDRVAELTMDCRPCSLHGPQVCPLGHHKCMKDQSPESILTQVGRLLSGTLNKE
ncbi:MAG TPA: glycosyltransferase family 9 protein [Gemmatimonadales bacterium]|nr:glycosyltransferase family 9 protein [Gemmatimonadales bacterium]